MPTYDDYGYEKVPYKADAVQWDGTNTQRVIDLIGGDIRLYDNLYLVVRDGVGGIFTMTKGWWAVKGQNQVVKCYDDATFKIKYRNRERVTVQQYQD
jgi:hypothetical protein